MKKKKREVDETKQKKKKEVDKHKQRFNDTDHQRAMAKPEVQEVFRALRSNWNKLSPPQRGEQLNKLHDSGCSVRGLARDLGEKDPTLRRYMKQANGSDIRTGQVAITSTKNPTRPRMLRAIDAARESQAMFQRNRTVGPVPKETGPAKKPQGASAAQPTKKIIASPDSIATKVPPIKNVGLDGKESGVESQRPKSLLEQWKQGHPSNSERIRLLASMQIEARPYRDARSMKRQGRPLPPTD